MKTMKKTIIISTFAAALLTTGCVSNEVFSPEEKQVEICFTTPVVGSLTKAPVYGEISGTTYPIDEDFVIFGVRHPNSYDGWASSNATTYINGAAFTHDERYNDDTDGSGGWKGRDSKYYWPMSGVLSFGGYSPASAKKVDSETRGKGTFTYDAKGLTITGFSVHTTASLQQDLMYAERVYGKTSNTGNNTIYDGVDIAFRSSDSFCDFAKTRFVDELIFFRCAFGDNILHVADVTCDLRYRVGSDAVETAFARLVVHELHAVNELFLDDIVDVSVLDYLDVVHNLFLLF